MQLKLTTTLYLLALATSVTQACHHPKPAHDVSCSLSFNRGKLSSNGTHITIQGTTTQSTRCQKKRDIPETVPGGSVIHVFTKDTVHVKDAQGKSHHGNDCQINVPEYSLPTIEKSETTKLVLPLKKDMVIDCERRQFKGQKKPSKSASKSSKAAPTTTSTKKAKHTSTTSTTTTTTHSTHTTHSTRTTHSTHTTTSTTTTEKEKETTTTTTHKKPTTTTTKAAKPTHSDDDDDDDDDDNNDGDWDYDHGTVTFFTPNQGACGEWNDDNDFIAALGEDLYGDMDEESKLCGKKILIEGPNGNDITVTVRDACPPCEASHIDLSPAAFAKLGKFDTGVLKVKWKFL